MNTEIKINYEEAKNKLAAMYNLTAGTGYKTYATSELVNAGSGKMFEATNRFQAELEQTEDVLIEVIHKTCRALCIGMREFIEQDQAAAELIPQELLNIVNRKDG